ncbi:FUSC family protein [Paenarthrobacter sp. DKR-5]|uniref:FUSC family protein n=1 Tax=Paenarthrobacter sp. DKR-5 TaxID=2835535 RepID=UPI002027CC1F|nr:FUSC family protein [Paenarthrobacter sp. DKR-5]
MVKRVLIHAKDLARIGPSQGDHLPALRVALGVSVPLVLLLLLGRPDLSIYAVFGAFTGMYGRADRHRRRLRHQTKAALLLTAGLTVGVWLSVLQVQGWILVAVEALFAVVGSFAADRARLKPSGPFYSIFALGACASVPTTIPAWLATAICAGSALFSILVGSAGALRERAARLRSHANGQVRRPPAPVARRNWPLAARSAAAVRVHAFRYLLAVGTAGTLGVLGGAGHANWTMASAAVPLAAANRRGRIHRGIHRVVGTLLGVALTALLLLPGFDSTGLTVLLMLLLFPTELFMARHYGMAMMFFTPAILLMSQLAHPISRWVLVADRGMETVLGAAVGMLVAVAVREPRAA